MTPLATLSPYISEFFILHNFFFSKEDIFFLIFGENVSSSIKKELFLIKEQKTKQEQPNETDFPKIYTLYYDYYSYIKSYRLQFQKNSVV